MIPPLLAGEYSDCLPSDSLADTVVAPSLAAAEYISHQSAQLVYGRGVGVRLAVDDAPFAGVSPWPLAAVLEQFLARHVGVNSFTELELRSRQRGRLAQWPARMGTRPAA